MCNTPFCNISRDNCAIAHKNMHQTIRDTIATSIATYEESLCRCWASCQKNVRKPNHHYFLKKVSQYTSNLYCNTPHIYIAVLSVPLRSDEREILSILLPFALQYAPHLHYNTSRSTFGKIFFGCGHRDVPHLGP